MVNRDISLGICKSSKTFKIAYMGLHKGEEPPVSKDKGSGAIFFSGCSLHCKYCQNHQIVNGMGIDISKRDLITIIYELKEMGAKTLNLVTPTHYTYEIVDILKELKRNNFDLQIVYNSSGYEKIQALELVDPYIDLYLMDLKTLDKDVAKKFCNDEDYPLYAKKAFEYLFNKRDTYIKNDNLYGIILRHLVFPGSIKATYELLDWFKDYKDKAYLSLMFQFVDPFRKEKFQKVSEREYNKVLDLLSLYEIDNGFIQELEDNDDDWIPDFSKDEPFLEGYSQVSPTFLKLKKRALANGSSNKLFTF